MISLEITIASLRLDFRKLNENKVIFNSFFLGPPPSRRKCLIMTKSSLTYCILRQGLVSRKGSIGNTASIKFIQILGKENIIKQAS